MVERRSPKPKVRGSNPFASAYLESWQTWCMRRTENPENVVRIHEIPPNMEMVVQLVRMLDCGSGGHGFESRLSPKNASVAQLDRASRYEREARRFESCPKFQI